MSLPFTALTFAGFGPGRLCPYPDPPEARLVSGRRPDALRRRVRQHCPRRAGVYGMFDARGELIYVGKSRCLRARVLSYFRPGSRPAKAGRIIERTRGLAWECAPGEFAALLRELELIQRWEPAFNVQGRPGRVRHRYVCIGRPPAAGASVARAPTGREAAAYGPVPGGWRVEEAVRRLNDAFRLRDCPQRQRMHFADQLELFPADRPAGCLRYEIGTCSGPCAAGCTRADYGEQVRAARRFLDGTDTRLLTELAAARDAAAASLNFERAAALRDKHAVLEWLADRLGWLRSARKSYSFVYPVEGDDGRAVWYVIRRGRVRAAAVPGSAAAAELVRATFARPGRDDDPLPPGGVDDVLLVASWFKKNPAERARLLTPARALAACGGHFSGE